MKYRTKTYRLLDLYTKLLSGQCIKSNEQVNLYGVDLRTIQRDIQEIRCYFADTAIIDGYIVNVDYDSDYGGYLCQKNIRDALSNEEILAICKILLSSRSLPKVNMEKIIQKLVNRCITKPSLDIVKSSLLELHQLTAVTLFVIS